MSCMIIETEINFSIGIMCFEISSDKLQKIPEIWTIRCAIQLAVHVFFNSWTYDTEDSYSMLSLIQWYFYDLIFSWPRFCFGQPRMKRWFI